MLRASEIPINMVCKGPLWLHRTSEESAIAQQGTDIHARVLTPDSLPETFQDWFSPQHQIYFEDRFTWVRYPIEDPNISKKSAIFVSKELPDNMQASGFTGEIDAYQVFKKPIQSCTYEKNNALITENLYAYHFNIADLKTGPNQVYRRGLTKVKDSWQMRTYAVLLWLYHDAPANVVGRLGWFRYVEENEEDQYLPETANFNYEDVRSWFHEILDLLQFQDAPKHTNLHRGKHCRYCPSFNACPSQGGLVRQFMDMLGTAQDASDLEQVWHAVNHVKIQLERVTSALTQMIGEKGITLENGDELYATSKLTRKIKNMERVKQLGEQMGVNLMEESTSLTLIKKRLGKKADSFLEELERLHLIKKEKSEKLYLAERKKQNV